MKAVLSLAQRASYADYLAIEHSSVHRHEFLDGVIVAMAGGSPEHNAIAARIGHLLSAHVPTGCLAYTPDQRYWIAATTRARYADASVICGKPERTPHDPHATTNPMVIVEVLSPTSAGDDDGDKRRDFQSLASLQVYVLVAQDARHVRVFRRDAASNWRDLPDAYTDGQTFELTRLSRALAVGEVYDGILDATGHSLLV